MKNTYQILLPVYNCEKTIVRSVNSILEQTFLTKENYEDVALTIVNNNSTDSTLEKILEISPEISKKLEFEILDCNIQGIVPALNTGLLKTRFNNMSHVCRIDGDDKWIPEKMEKQDKFLQINPNIKILGTQIRAVSKDTYESLSEQTKRPTSDPEIKQWLYKGHNPIAHPSVIFSKEILLKAGYDDLFPVAEDLCLWLKSAMWFEFANLDDILVEYTVSHNPDYNPRVSQFACQIYKAINKGL